MNLLHTRLRNQQIIGSAFDAPDALVTWFGAVQAQDYAGALWAIGARLRSATAQSVEKAVTEGKLVRTWPMRGTLHFVPSQDVRWMLRYLAPRWIANAGGRLRQLELDEVTIARGRDLLVRALEREDRLTRKQAYAVLSEGGIEPAGQRGIHVLVRLAQEGVLCEGPREGRQDTFVLLEEWVAPSSLPGRGEALATLANRYFRSHGPATLDDFAWWSGLTKKDARAACSSAEDITERTLDGRSYWIPRSERKASPDNVEASSPVDAQEERHLPGSAHLLPAWDEYAVAYRDRRALVDPSTSRALGAGISSPIVVVNGRVVGTWKRRLSTNAIVVTASAVRGLTSAEKSAIGSAADQFGAFLGREARLEIVMNEGPSPQSGVENP